MGLPLSWIIYSIYHSYLWSLARRASVVHAPAERFVLCGDDLLGVGTLATVREYERLFRLGYGAFSVGKHFVSRQRRGVFVEQLVSRPGDAPASFVDAFPVAGMVHLGVPVPGLTDSVPSWARAGPIISSYLGLGMSRPRLRRVQRVVWPELVRSFLAWKIPPFVPREFGGAGLIGPEDIKRCAPNYVARAVVRLATDQSDSSDRSVFSRPWSALADGMADRLANDEAVESFDHSFAVIKVADAGPSQHVSLGLRVAEVGQRPVLVDNRTPEQLQKAVAARRAFAYRTMGIPNESSILALKPWTLSRVLRRRWRKHVSWSFGGDGGRISRLLELHAEWQYLRRGCVVITDRQIRLSGRNPIYIPVLGLRNPYVGQRVIHDALWGPRREALPFEGENDCDNAV